ncbi:hypothetical protein BS78_05G058100 [Paspalum vaginatum]|nr:hypothetical protein BS78_05G058100 [Paspalum vaginatum]
MATRPSFVDPPPPPLALMDDDAISEISSASRLTIRPSSPAPPSSVGPGACARSASSTTSPAAAAGSPASSPLYGYPLSPAAGARQQPHLPCHRLPPRLCAPPLRLPNLKRLLQAIDPHHLGPCHRRPAELLVARGPEPLLSGGALCLARLRPPRLPGGPFLVVTVGVNYQYHDDESTTTKTEMVWHGLASTRRGLLRGLRDRRAAAA